MDSLGSGGSQVHVTTISLTRLKQRFTGLDTNLQFIKSSLHVQMQSKKPVRASFLPLSPCVLVDLKCYLRFSLSTILNERVLTFSWSITWPNSTYLANYIMENHIFYCRELRNRFCLIITAITHPKNVFILCLLILGRKFLTLFLEEDN